MEVHGALHTLDNVTDVSQSLDSLAEQVSYIWFTKELDALSLSEAPPKDPGSGHASSEGRRAPLPQAQRRASHRSRRQCCCPSFSVGNQLLLLSALLNRAS